MATTTTSLTTASVLAFERKIDPSDALFFAGLWANRNDSATWGCKPKPAKISE
jgi:CRISPR-associated protein Csy3